MTLYQLKELVDSAIEEGGGELRVCIPNNLPSIGPISVTNVISATHGFDWNSHMFIIWPENKMTELTKK